jgi:lipid A ethanolaminephosphotransferase
MRLVNLWKTRQQWQFEISPVWLALGLALYCSFFLNDVFWTQLLRTQPGAASNRWGFFWPVYIAVTALHFGLFNLLFYRRTARLLTGLLLLVAISANYFSEHFGVHYDLSMMRNIYATHQAEALDLLSTSLLREYLLYGLPPLLLLMVVRMRPEPWGRLVLTRLGWTALAMLVLLGSLLLVFKQFASTMRNHKDIRHLIVPSSILASSTRLVVEKGQSHEHLGVGLDARIAPVPAGTRPTLVVLVVGETARAANWGLSGYARQTTPQLQAKGVINYPYAISCGTNTEVSVPCMFSVQGRHHYDQAGIRNSDSVLHVLDRAGVAVTWIDNQSGCKGVCKGLHTIEAEQLRQPALCPKGNCPDEVALVAMQAQIAAHKGDQLIVVHQMGNHGPAYFARYPKAFERFTPACRNLDLEQCTSEQIVNAYDNALFYTDHVLAQMITVLQAVQDRDVAFIYMSDHGESLGENGFYLHGLPYAMAPEEQVRVPFVSWYSESFYKGHGVSKNCVRERSAKPAHHDNLFHTVLGLFRVSTQVYEAEMDLHSACHG